MTLSAVAPRAILLLAALACSTACSQAAPAVEVVEGGCADVYGGSICTWATLESERVVEVGATVPIATVQNAPAEGEMVWPPVEVATIALPQVAQQRTGLQNVKIYWEVHGHPPGPYLVPHFDFHFYVTSRAETEAVDCNNVSKPTELPAGYDLPDVEIPGIGTLIGLCVPKMGMHALPTAELESTQAFSGTLVVGYYAGELIFLEPMITRDLLLRQQSFPLEIPAVAGAGPGVTLPTRFEAEYDASASAYRFVLSGFQTN